MENHPMEETGHLTFRRYMGSNGRKRLVHQYFYTSTLLHLCQISACLLKISSHCAAFNLQSINLFLELDEIYCPGKAT